jgi:hypothetical protein
MLLIYPPAARSPEPPLGIARLAGYLRAQGRESTCIDLCLEGIDFLLGREPEAEGAWTKGALKRRASASAALKNLATYASPDRYARAVGDLNRALRAASAPAGAEASLADYRESGRSPLKKSDLLDSAKRFTESLFYPLFESRIGPELEASADGLVGISVCFLSQALCAFALAGYIHARKPEARILLGGGLVTSWLSIGAISASETFGDLIDGLIRGPGEAALGAVLGISEIKARCGPYFGDFSNLGYFSPTKILPFNFSSGCPWKRCSFCPETAEDSPYRGIPAREAISQLRGLCEAENPGILHFTDNEIAPLYLRALAAEAPGPAWYGFARFSRLLLDPAFCEALAASGCLMLQLGLESGDQSVLDALGKGTRLDEISIALGNLRQSGIGVYLYLLFGTPSEGRDAALRTRDYVACHAEEIYFVNVAIFNLPSSGAETKSLDTRSFYEGDLSLYREFRHPKGWDRPAVREFLSRDFSSVPEIRSLERRTPPVFTSSHAPFFLTGAISP